MQVGLRRGILRDRPLLEGHASPLVIGIVWLPFSGWWVTRVPKETRQEDHHLVKHQALSSRHRKRDSLKRDTSNRVVVPSGLGGRKRRSNPRFPRFTPRS